MTVLQLRCCSTLCYYRNLVFTHFFHAYLFGADLASANLRSANLFSADLTDAKLRSANLTDADLSGTDLSRAHLVKTVFGSTHLSDVKGLEECRFDGPCIIDHGTIARSDPLPESFLRGCGLADWQIEAAKLNQADLTPSQITDIRAGVDGLPPVSRSTAPS